MKARIWTDKQGIRMLENNINVLQGENLQMIKLKEQFNKQIIFNKNRIKNILEEIEIKKLGESRGVAQDEE